MTEPETLYCINHPDRETLLRCNKCEEPICTQCAIQTPTGYRCTTCIRGQQKKFNTAQASDYIFAPLIAGVISLIGSYLVSFIGFFTLLAAPFVAMIIERSVRAAIKNRRSKVLFTAAAAGAALGGLPLLISALLPAVAVFRGGGINIFSILPLIWRGAYLIITTSAVYYRLKGISF